jgi:drug/metabolite transporter (DMT)-like permease
VTERLHRPILAIALRLAAAALLAAQLALVKLTGEIGVSLPEIVFWRQAVAIPLIVAWVAATGARPLLRTERLWVHGRRAALGICAIFLMLGATLRLPLAELTTLTFTGPLFAVALSALILREPVGKYRWFAVALGFAGVAIVTQPWAESGGEPLSALGVAMASLAAMFHGLIAVQVRDLGRTEHPLTSVLYFSLFSMIPLVPLFVIYGSPHPPGVYAMLLAIGTLGLAVQLALTAALRFASVATVTPMDYSGLAWSALLGWLIWDHLPPLATWLGAPLIVAAGLIVVWREHVLARAPQKSAVLQPPM